MQIYCDYCNKEIHQTPSQYRRSTYHFCSREHMFKFKSEFKPPTKKPERMYLILMEINKVSKRDY